VKAGRSLVMTQEFQKKKVVLTFCRKIMGKFLRMVITVRAINLLAHVFKPPICTINTIGVKLDKFMTAVFIPELKKCFEEASYSKDGDHESQIIVLVNGSVYEIGEDYSWCHDVVGAYAVGSGSAYALGVLNALSEGKKRTLTNARSAIKTALAVSAQFGSMRVITSKLSNK